VSPDADIFEKGILEKAEIKPKASILLLTDIAIE